MDNKVRGLISRLPGWRLATKVYKVKEVFSPELLNLQVRDAG